MALDPFEFEVDEVVASKTHRRRVGLRMHASMWLAVNAFLFMIYAVTDFGGFPWFLFPAGGTLIPLALHGAWASAPVDRVKVARELERAQPLDEEWD